MNKVGLVAIGRNEGDRISQCLVSVIGKVSHVVYVDSGSTDDRVEMPRSLGQKEAVDFSAGDNYWVGEIWRSSGYWLWGEIRPETIGDHAKIGVNALIISDIRAETTSLSTV